LIAFLSRKDIFRLDAFLEKRQQRAISKILSSFPFPQFRGATARFFYFLTFFALVSVRSIFI